MTDNSLADKVLFESRNFVVTPTAGSIVPGWLLLIPKTHHLCFGELNESLWHEMLELRTLAADALYQVAGNVAFFEHGPSQPATTVGCGVDHAHLHLVSTDINLLAGARKISKSPINWERCSGIHVVQDYWNKKNPYLYVEQAGEAWIGTHSQIESQLFRKVIANGVGLTDCFDWKTHSFEENISKSIKAIDSLNLKNINSTCA